MIFWVSNAKFVHASNCVIPETACEIGHYISVSEWKFLPLNDGDIARYVHRVLELYPFYSQCILIPGMALERWFLVCWPAQAAAVLKSRSRFVFYIGISFLALLVPSVILTEFIWFQFNPIEIEREEEVYRIYSDDGEFYITVRTGIYTWSRRVSASALSMVIVSSVLVNCSILPKFVHKFLLQIFCSGIGTKVQ